MPPPANPIPLPPAKRQFLSSLLDVLVRQLAWPQDADWEAPGTEDPDPGDDMAMFQNLRIVSYREQEVAKLTVRHVDLLSNILPVLINPYTRR
jgi:exportin-T